MSAVSEIMSKGISTIELDSNPSALDVAEAMVKHRSGAVIATREGKPAGIITERDLLKKVTRENKRPDQVRAEDIMSSPVITVMAYDSIDTAADKMTKNKIKRLAVMEDDGSIVAMLSATDIAKKLAKILTDDYNRYRSLKDTLDL